PVPESRTKIFEFEHVFRLGRAAVQVPLVPSLVIGKFVIGREEGMGLAIALGLSRLIQSLPVRPLFSILTIHRFASEGFDQRKHTTIRKVSIVGDCQYPPPSFLFISSHPIPEIPRVIATERLHGRE